MWLYKTSVTTGSGGRTEYGGCVKGFGYEEAVSGVNNELKPLITPNFGKLRLGATQIPHKSAT